MFFKQCPFVLYNFSEKVCGCNKNLFYGMWNVSLKVNVLMFHTHVFWNTVLLEMLARALSLIWYLT